MDFGYAHGNRFTICTGRGSVITHEEQLHILLLERYKLRSAMLRSANRIQRYAGQVVWAHHPTLLHPFPLHSSTTDGDLVSLIHQRLRLLENHV